MIKKIKFCKRRVFIKIEMKKKIIYCVSLFRCLSTNNINFSIKEMVFSLLLLLFYSKISIASIASSHCWSKILCKKHGIFSYVKMILFSKKQNT